MKVSKKLFVGALVLALGAGAIFAPVVGNAEAADTTVQTENQKGYHLGQYFAGSMKDTVAATIGITVDELSALRVDGNSLAQIADAQGVSNDQLIASLTNAKIEQIEALYADGKITEAQKENMLTQMDERMLEKINRTEVGNQGKGNSESKENRFSQDGESKRGQGQGNGFGTGQRYNSNNN